MMRRNLRVILGVVIAAAATRAGGQDLNLSRRAFAIGLNSSAGLVGIEWVARSFSPASRLGGAVGVGVFGGGARLNMALSESRASNRVPYLAAGLSLIAWLPVGITPQKIASIETGMQFWPTNTRRFYMDIGAGAGLELGSAGDPVPAFRVVVGRTF